MTEHLNQSVPPTGRALMPHEYEMVWHLMVEGPSTAAELASWRNGRQGDWTAWRIAPQLRSLVRRGWVSRAETGHYSATQRAFEAVSW